MPEPKLACNLPTRSATLSTTEQRLAANRTDALHSTGPTSPHGKSVASRNAIRHGVLSGRLLLDDEAPADFDDLLWRLVQSLAPVGAIEETLVERMAVTIWRQRRLVACETANLSLARQAKKIAAAVSSELGRSYGSEFKQDELAPFDPASEAWSRKALAEIEALEELDLAVIEQAAPLVFEQLTSDAEEDQETPAAFIASYEGGLVGYIVQLAQWCREQLREAEARPHALALAEEVRAKRLVLAAETLEVMSRYQTTLDNQLFKLLRALRDAQEWRLKTLESKPAPNSPAATAEAMEAA